MYWTKVNRRVIVESMKGIFAFSNGFGNGHIAAVIGTNEGGFVGSGENGTGRLQQFGHYNIALCRKANELMAFAECCADAPGNEIKNRISALTVRADIKRDNERIGKGGFVASGKTRWVHMNNCVGKYQILTLSECLEQFLNMLSGSLLSVTVDLQQVNAASPGVGGS